MSASTSYANKTTKALKALALSLRHYKKPLPSSDKEEQRVHIKGILDKIKELPNVVLFLDSHIGKTQVKPVKSGRAGAVRLLAQYLGGKFSIVEMEEAAVGFFQKNYEARAIHRGQAPLNETIPEKIKAFLPPKIVIKLDNDGYIKEITDMYDNESYGLLEKINAQQKILREYKTIQRKVWNGFDSKDEAVKNLSIILGVIIETGIRPGSRSNGIKEILSGKEVRKETFGAVSLKRKHLVLSKDEIKLEFEGKKGTINRATIKDKRLLMALKGVCAERRGGDLYLFPDVEYEDLAKFFKKNFEGLKITDFRKLRATKEVYDGLKAEQARLFKTIKGFVGLEVKKQEEMVIDAIADTLKSVHSKAQTALSHESSKTTEKSYINPQILLSFLSNGGLLPSIEECVLEGKTRLVFDIQSFLKNSKRVASVGGVKYPIMTTSKGLDRNLSDILFDLIECL